MSSSHLGKLFWKRIHGIRTFSRGCLPKGTKQLDLRRRDWPPPRMACTTRPGLGKVGTRRIAVVVAVACSVGHQSSSTSNAEDSGWTLWRGSHRPPSDEVPKRPRDESREGSTPRSCEGLDSPRPRLARHDCPRFRPRFRMVSHLLPAPAQLPVAANWHSVTERIRSYRHRCIYIYNFAFGNDDKMILSITNVFFFLEFSSLKLREEGIKFRISDIVRPRERERERNDSLGYPIERCVHSIHT